MTAPDIKIEFAFEPGVFCEIHERVAFWDSPTTIEWFRDRGYILYKRIVNEDGSPTPWSTPMMPYNEQGEDEYPYALYDTVSTNDCYVPLRTDEMQCKVAFAQDLLNRHVAIKIVRANTDEYAILNLLRQEKLETLKENCVIPVLDILPIEGFFFVVMPRWGTGIHIPWPQNVREVLFIMHSTLKGLNFLHNHNIAHRDIKLDNVLVNHFADSFGLNGNTIRLELRSKGCLSYALFDFDHSIKLPPEIDRAHYRIPAHMSWGSFNVTTDTAQGEFDFNPFVTDVGSLGVLFCYSYAHLTQEVPILAPFLDKLTTRNLSTRFTANEALLFFEENFLQLSTAELDQMVYPRDPATAGRPYYEYDRWANVLPDFSQKWAHYKEPPIPWTTFLLRKICRTKLRSSAVSWIRRLLSLPRRRSFL